MLNSGNGTWIKHTFGHEPETVTVEDASASSDAAIQFALYRKQ
jgi:hypothetical protein